MRDLGVAISGNGGDGGGDGGGDTVGTAGGVNFPRLKFLAVASTIRRRQLPQVKVFGGGVNNPAASTSPG